MNKIKTKTVLIELWGSDRALPIPEYRCHLEESEELSSAALEVQPDLTLQLGRFQLSIRRDFLMRKATKHCFGSCGFTK